jgi:hypothetical protein
MMSRPIRRIRKPDVVTLRVATIDGVLVITGSSVIGSAVPCVREIEPGRTLSTAHRCLVRCGFRLIATRTNVRLYRRPHHHHHHHHRRSRPC